MHCAHTTVIVRAGRYHTHKPCWCATKPPYTDAEISHYLLGSPLTEPEQTGNQ